MRNPFTSWTALLLILSVACMAIVPSNVQAMLMAASPARPDVVSVNRAQDLKTIQTTLESRVLRERLHAMGLSDAEIQARLSRLSDDQIHQLALQIRAVRPGGDLLIGLLVAVLLVVLIIYLIKRI
jgi:hypothetical protein